MSAESIAYVQPNFVYTPSTITPNDPFSSTGNNFVNLCHIDDAWSISTGSSTTVIAVIDTGTNITHEDLVDSLWINTGELDDNLDNDDNGYVDDMYGANTGVTLGSQSSGVVNGDVFHGTHVAGIIAAQLNNHKGIAGACPGCKIMTIKANLPNLGFFTTASLVAGIDYAIQMGADIINFSLGGSPNSDDTLFYAAIQAATRANIASVVAAGNEQDNIDITPSVPAVFPEVIAVSATDGTVFDSSYSNFGSAIWVAAPGTEIASALTGSPNSYGFSSGTSMAAPVVSGVLGLLKSYQPRLTVADLKQLLQLYSDDLGQPGHDNFYGYGLINAYRALSAIASDNVFPTIPSSSIPTHCESDTGSIVRLIATDNSAVSPSVTATVNFYSNAVLSRTEFPTINAIAPSTYEFKISTPGLTVSRIQVQLSAIDINNNRTTLADTDIDVTDLTPPYVSTPNTYIDDQLSGLVTLPIQDISGVVTTSIRVQYTTSSNTSIKTTLNDPSSVSFNAGILGIQLSDFGYIPSISGTLAI
ncbi:hypothetical protein EBR57_09060, partial [bacterium]|nr:hypothetical protein [bacterium]